MAACGQSAANPPLSTSFYTSSSSLTTSTYSQVSQRWSL